MSLTARTLLFGDAAGSPALLLPTTPGWRQVRAGLAGALRSVSAAGRDLVDRQLAAAIDGVLGVDVGGVVVGGWRKHHSLLAAARATKDDPGKAESVALAAHDITSSYHPYVEVAVNGVALARAHVDLGISLEIDGVVAIVSQAKLVALQGGGIAAAITLGCEGHQLASRRVAGIDPMVAVALGAGIPLLRDDRSPTPA
jgi:hypothetical protein